LRPAVIEPLTQSDLAQVVEIETESFPEPWGEDKFLQELKLKFSYFFTAKSGAEIAGYIGLWHAADEGNIINIAVKKSWRRQGLGKQLIDFILEFSRAKGIKDVYLEVRSKNLSAQGLYKKCGFEACYERQGYYVDDSAIVMHKKVGQP